ncbi:hypothetical protein DFQ30_001508 [Apophysomyces sp. BC1015]|nr:hypothetical protein DFQ30_001508 [Apophysomyces sp. BC1015]
MDIRSLLNPLPSPGPGERAPGKRASDATPRALPSSLPDFGLPQGKRRKTTVGSSPGGRPRQDLSTLSAFFQRARVSEDAHPASATVEQSGPLGATNWILSGQETNRIKKSGGAKALETLSEKAEALHRAGFSKQEAVAIASNIGGSQALDKVLATHAQLTAVGFKHEQIVAIASKGGGSQALDKVLVKYAPLTAAGFTHQQIVAIASNKGGSQALDKVLATHAQLTTAGFAVEDVSAIAAHIGGAPALQAVVDHLELLMTRHSKEDIVKAGAKQRGAAAHVKQMANACRIKQESAAQSPRPMPTVLVERPIDQARTAFIPELQHCDLTGGTPIWSLDEASRVVLRHPMDPIEGNNDLFPLRDLTRPLDRVYERYADKNGKCHPNVKLTNIDLASGYKKYFNELCRDSRVGLSPSETANVRGRLLTNARTEFERLIREEAAPERPCKVRQLDHGGLLEHERMLAGQYGLFLAPAHSPQDQCTLRNGRILGFYMGMFAANEQQINAIEAQHPDYESYAMDAMRPGGKLTVYSALGCANDLAFANTALCADTPEPAYDRERLNAEFIPFEVKLTDRHGKPARETVVAMVALDNAIGKEIRVDYGDAFLRQFTTPRDRARSEEDAVVVKMEVDD